MSVRGQSADMVQPNESPGSDYALSGGCPGDGSLGKLATLPSELTNHEGFQRLLVENQDLRDALQQSNAMLRLRHSELLEFQDNQRKESEFIKRKFGEARSLVQMLTKERSALQAQLNGASRRLSETTTKGERPVGHTETRQPGDATVTDQRPPKKPFSEEDNTSPGSSLSSCETTLTRSLCETLRPLDHEGSARAEQEEAGDKEARTETETPISSQDRRVRTEQELQRKLQEAEGRNTRLQHQLTELQGVVSELRRQEAEKGAEAHRQLQALQQQLEQLAEEKVSVKAQVTSLLGELNESQLSLESCMQEKKKLEESLQCVCEQQREWDAQVKKHMVQLDQHRMQVQNLETALKRERQNACEEMRKLAQLQAAYHQLFQEYDTHIKSSLQQERNSKGADLQVQELKQQLQEAEEALVAKQELIDKLKEAAEQYRAQLDTILVLKAQADIYRTDFLAEREAREKLNGEKVRLQEQLDELQRERGMIEEMRNRHSDNIRPSLLPGAYAGPLSYSNPPASSFHALAELQEFSCPKCRYRAPDMDTLQIHVMDCIQ
ncbi:NF-kappa-B essential modulator isoform X2 [Ascaphus truei]|uniref:NF-kappa-B essential modulator isoform X2 n=1 Tax=Ascaphus truei TaxID=8439 RepID=UPI003F5A69CB